MGSLGKRLQSCRLHQAPTECLPHSLGTASEHQEETGHKQPTAEAVVMILRTPSCTSQCEAGPSLRQLD